MKGGVYRILTEQQSSEIRERKGSKGNRFGNHPQANDVNL